MVDISFETNRPQVGGDQMGPFGWGTPAAGNALFCAVATVDNVDVTTPSSGRITKIDKLVSGNFGPQHLQPILSSGNDVLVFVHGCANDFTDAITRAAYNQAWLAASNLPNSAFDVIAFTWPACQYNFANIFADYADYRQDQAAAAASAPPLPEFLNQMTAPRRDV